jgi:hypothetical protein
MVVCLHLANDFSSITKFLPPLIFNSSSALAGGELANDKDPCGHLGFGYYAAMLLDGSSSSLLLQDRLEKMTLFVLPGAFHLVMASVLINSALYAALQHQLQLNPHPGLNYRSCAID